MKYYRVPSLVTALVYLFLVGFCAQGYASGSSEEQTFKINDTKIIVEQVDAVFAESAEEVYILQNGSSSLVVTNMDSEGFDIASEDGMPQRVGWANMENAELGEVDNFQRIAFDDFKLFATEQELSKHGCKPKKCREYCKKKGCKGGYCAGNNCKPKKCYCYGCMKD